MSRLIALATPSSNLLITNSEEYCRSSALHGILFQTRPLSPHPTSIKHFAFARQA